MSAGLTVYNDNNILQIDSTYKNLALRQTGQRSFTTTGDFTLSYSGPNAPLIFIRPVSISGGSGNQVGTVEIYQVVGAPGAWQITLRGVANSGQTMVYEYFLYDDQIARENFGMEVFDENSNLVFSSANDPLKIVGFVSGDITTGRNYIRNLINSGIRVAVCQCLPAWFTNSNESGDNPPIFQNTSSETAIGLFNNQFDFQAILKYANFLASDPIPNTSGPGVWLVADVTTAFV